MKSKFFMLLALSCSAFCVEPGTAYTQQNSAQTPPNVAPQAQAPYPQAHMPQNYGLPPKIMQTINQMYPGVYIRDVDYEAYGYEVELGNRMDLFFDRAGNLLGQKYDY